MYINLSLFFAFAVLFPDFTVRLFFILPVKIKWLALLNAVFFAWGILVGLLIGNFGLAFLPLIAILNFFVICYNDMLSLFRPIKARVKNKSNFTKYKQSTDSATQSNIKPYRHKCAVCGRTDIDNPGLEFRYCSRCEGYHCFCIDHINNHIHFTE